MFWINASWNITSMQRIFTVFKHINQSVKKCRYSMRPDLSDTRYPHRSITVWPDLSHPDPTPISIFTNTRKELISDSRKTTFSRLAHTEKSITHA